MWRKGLISIKTGSKWAHLTCLCTPMVQDHFWKNAFLNHFSPNFGPKAAPFQHILGFPWAKTRHHELEMGKKHLFEHPEWSRIIFGKTRF